MIYQDGSVIFRLLKRAALINLIYPNCADIVLKRTKIVYRTRRCSVLTDGCVTCDDDELTSIN